MGGNGSENTLEGLRVRSYHPRDQDMVSRLYTEGLLAGQIAANDTGADIENIDDAYLSEPRNHFWVADLDSTVVGMIGVAHDHEHTAEIRRLRVDKHWQKSPIGARLVEKAISHCKKSGYLKIVLDTRFDPSAAVGLFDRFGFQHTRTKSLQGKDLLEFYLDIYRQRSSHGDDPTQTEMIE